MSDRLLNIIQRIASGESSEADIVALRQALEHGEGRALSQLGKYNITIGEGQNIQIGDRTYVEMNDAAVRAIVAAIQRSIAPNSLKQIDFQPYLQSIIEDEDYREWQDLYTSTTAEGRKQLPQPKFSPRLKLRVETVKPKNEQEGREDEDLEQQEQVERWDVLAGLRHYSAEHVLLIGKPGSGKSTSLERLLWEEANNALYNWAVRSSLGNQSSPKKEHS